MKNLFRFAILAMLLPMLAALVACNSDDDNTWEKNRDWRERNVRYFRSMRDSVDANGNLYYQTVYPDWNPSAEILVHYFNDRALTAGNLRPLYTSTCDVIYYGQLIDATPFDSSYRQTQYGKAIMRMTPQKTITGFAIALTNMHVGDSVEVLIPYELAYGDRQSNLIKPYSTLKYNMRLVDIAGYEVRP